MRMRRPSKKPPPSFVSLGKKVRKWWWAIFPSAPFNVSNWENRELVLQATRYNEHPIRITVTAGAQPIKVIVENEGYDEARAILPGESATFNLGGRFYNPFFRNKINVYVQATPLAKVLGAATGNIEVEIRCDVYDSGAILC